LTNLCFLLDGIVERLSGTFFSLIVVVTRFFVTRLCFSSLCLDLHLVSLLLHSSSTSRNVQSHLGYLVGKLAESFLASDGIFLGSRRWRGKGRTEFESDFSFGDGCVLNKGEGDSEGRFSGDEESQIIG
jgi:hypothetical protein